MRRLLVLVLVAPATLFARSAFACRCAGNPTFRSAVHEAEVAFTR